jgi:protein required for attachment to host cells
MKELILIIRPEMLEELRQHRTEQDVTRSGKIKV